MTQSHRDIVRIFDTTLRDGEQSPGATMTHAQKLEIARMLEEAGVDIIEAGFPIASNGDFEAVQAIARQSKRAVICGLARAQFPDIDRAWQAIKDAPYPRIHTFIGTSPLHRDITRLDEAGMVERVTQTVSHARDLCADVQWSPMDATRTEFDFLCRTIEAAIAAGATTINIPDTVGYAIPGESAALIVRLREMFDDPALVFATHCHDDLGLAVANSLAAVQGGARQVECTINGLGERAGNAALEEVVMALRVRADALPYETGVDSTKLTGLSRKVAMASGFAVQHNKAVVGRNAFAHESGIHQDGMLKNAATFEIMRPEDVGIAGTSLVMGKHSGRAALRARLEALGHSVGDNQLKDVFVRFKALADRKKEILDADLEALMGEVDMASHGHKVQVADMHYQANMGGQASVTAAFQVGGHIVEVEAAGDGPVDAAFKAIRKAYPHGGHLDLFQVHAVTQGTDAQATVSVRLKDQGRIFAGQASDTDTIVASAKAYLAALNALVADHESD